MDFLNFRNRTLTCEDHQVAAEVTGEFHACRAGDGHLRGTVDGKIRREFADEPTDADILNDGSVHTCSDYSAQIFRGIGEFVLEDERVECDVALHAAPMQELHQLGQIGDGEVVRSHPRVEFFEAKVDRVRAVFNGGFGALPITSGREKFGQSGILLRLSERFNFRQINHVIRLTGNAGGNQTCFEKIQE